MMDDFPDASEEEVLRPQNFPVDPNLLSPRRMNYSPDSANDEQELKGSQIQPPPKRQVYNTISIQVIHKNYGINTITNPQRHIIIINYKTTQDKYLSISLTY